MICRHCGTEIADKAIVCYRCGAATTDPVRRPAAVRPRRGGLGGFIIIVALIFLALFLGQAGRAPSGQTAHIETVAAIVLAVAAAVLLIWMIVKRRR